MGIRYYAYPVAQDLVGLALQSPEKFLAEDPLADAWQLGRDRPPMLYLDKCWSELQALLGASEDRPARRSFALVEGAVTHTDEGWLPFYRALSPYDVRQVADDLAKVDANDVNRLLAEHPRWGEHHGEEMEREYINQYLTDAQSFTAELSRDGLGLVYMIG